MSLYVQITRRCNMTCNHCAFSCGAQGPDMSAETFRRVLDLAEREQQPITIGGGEPTLHPRFMDFLWWTIRRQAPLTYEMGMPAVGLVTNGSQTDIALELAALARVGVISASVSKDEFHDPIDPRVYQAFEPSKEPGDYRHISRPGLIVPAGRARNWGTTPSNAASVTALSLSHRGNLFVRMPGEPTWQRKRRRRVSANGLARSACPNEAARPARPQTAEEIVPA